MLPLIFSQIVQEGNAPVSGAHSNPSAQFPQSPSKSAQPHDSPSCFGSIPFEQKYNCIKTILLT